MATLTRRLSIGLTMAFALALISASASADHRHHRKYHAFKHHYKHHHHGFRHSYRHYYPRHYSRHSHRHHSYFGFYVGPSLYYYGDHHYYRRHPRTREYVVIDKPDGADEALQAAVAEELYIYPREGQSADKQERDRYDCHVWATEQSGVDPSLSEVSQEEVLDYRRATSACLEGRGYTVK